MSHTSITRLCLLLVCVALVFITSASVSAQTPLYQLHKDGKIWRFTGTPCAGSNCPGWQMIDNNPATISIVADGSLLYQLHNTGMIFRFTGTPCNGDHCPGWLRLDNNAATKSIVAANGQLYQLHNNGKIFQFTGTPCNGEDCFGWQMLDNNTDTRAIVADTVPLVIDPLPAAARLRVGTGTVLYQLHKTGKIFRFTGTPCSGDACPGWQMIHNDPRNSLIASDGRLFYRLNVAPSWQHAVRTIWRFTGTPCSGSTCPGWEKLDRNNFSSQIEGNRVQLYQMYVSGHILRFNGTPCTGNVCPGWQLLDNNPRSRAIASH